MQKIFMTQKSVQVPEKQLYNVYVYHHNFYNFQVS